MAREKAVAGLESKLNDVHNINIHEDDGVVLSRGLPERKVASLKEIDVPSGWEGCIKRSTKDHAQGTSTSISVYIYDTEKHEQPDDTVKLSDA